MIKSVHPSLLAAALLLSSCSSQPQENQQQAASQPGRQPGNDDAARSSANPTKSDRGLAETIEHPTDNMAPTDNREETSWPEGVLPLKPGVYVLQNSGCAAPANAAVRFYDGRGISGSATHSCRTLVNSRRGDSYVVEQSCIDTPSGNGPRTSESQTITVHDAMTFTMQTTDESSRFRYCPTGELPGYLRERMTRLR